MFGIHLPHISPRRIVRSVSHAASSVVHRTTSSVSHARSFFQHEVHQARSVVRHARTAARHVRHAVRARTASTARHVARSTRHFTHSFRSTASHVRHSVRSSARFIRRAVPRSYHRIRHVASRVMHRAAHTRTFRAVRHAASRAIHHPIARRLGRGLRAAHHALGHGHSLVKFGQNVAHTVGGARTAARDIRHALRTHKLSDVRKAIHSTREAFGSAKDLVESATGARKALRAAARTLRSKAPKTYARLAHLASGALRRTGVGRGLQALRRAGSRVAHHSLTRKLAKGLKLGRRAFGHASNLVNFGSNLKHLPGKFRTAAGDIRRALRTHSAADIHKALNAAHELAGGVRDVVQGAKDARHALRAGWKTFGRVAPRVAGRVGRAASHGLRRSGALALGRAGRRLAAKVGSRAAFRAGARIGGKALGRFAPGGNIAMAGLDIAAFVKTMKDKKASKGQKILAGVRALGSIAAATNIPIVSQAGAAVATVADIASAVHLPKHLPKLHLPKVHVPKLHLW